MSEPWFHVSALPVPGEITALDAVEARHARGVRRLGPGDAVVLFDGSGSTARAVLCGLDHRSVEVRVESAVERARPEPMLHVVSALPKSDRLSRLLSMGTQLGMSSFSPLHCHRGLARPRADAQERWARILREACKQSRRAWMPEIGEPCPIDDVAVRADGRGPVLLLDPAGESPEALLACSELRSSQAIWLIVGPEGGLDDEERERLTADGALCMSLSDGILRIETAVSAALALLGQLRPHGDEPGLPSESSPARS